MILGIDPGLSGGLALIGKDGVITEPMPNVGGILDLPSLTRWLRIHAESIEMAYLENVHSRPGMGAPSVFKFGRVYGIIEGMLAAFNIPYTLVTPQKWMKELHAGIEGSLDTKAKSRIAASRLFPSVNLLATGRSRVTHEGMVEALLIAEWGRRQRSKS